MVFPLFIRFIPLCVDPHVDSEDRTLFSLSTFLDAARNHWFAAALVFIATAGLAVLAMFILPRSYESEAMIFVKLGRETVSLDPTATTGSTMPVLESRDNEINSIRDMLYSRGIMERVVDRLGPDVVLGDAELTDEVHEVEEFPEKDYLNSPRQQAIKALVEDTYVISSRKSSVLTLSAKASSPELAQRILKEYLQVYQQMHTDAHQSPESNNFFKEQTRLLRGQWEESMKALQIAKEDAGVVSIDGARDNLKAQTYTVQSSLMSVTSSLASTTARLEKFKSLVSRNPLAQQRVSQEYLAAKGEFAGLTAQKKTLKKQLDELLASAAKLNRDEVTIGQLQKTVELQSANFSQYQELYEETRIEEALHGSQFTNVRVVQEPSFVPKAVGPKKSLIGAAGLVAATTGAILAALLLELLSIFRRQRKLRAQSSRETEVRGNSEAPENGDFLAGPSIANG